MIRRIAALAAACLVLVVPAPAQAVSWANEQWVPFSSDGNNNLAKLVAQGYWRNRGFAVPEWNSDSWILADIWDDTGQMTPRMVTTRYMALLRVQRWFYSYNMQHRASSDPNTVRHAKRNFCGILTHETGHLVGLPDYAAGYPIMSGYWDDSMIPDECKAWFP